MSKHEQEARIYELQGRLSSFQQPGGVDSSDLMPSVENPMESSADDDDSEESEEE